MTLDRVPVEVLQEGGAAGGEAAKGSGHLS